MMVAVGCDPRRVASAPSARTAVLQLHPSEPETQASFLLQSRSPGSSTGPSPREPDGDQTEQKSAAGSGVRVPLVPLQPGSS